MPFSSLCSKVAIITGATSGIGLATAKLMLSFGTHLSVTGRDVNALKRIESEFKQIKPHSKLLTTQCDLNKEIEVENLVNSTIEYFGKLDILVNSAGVIEFGSIENTSLDQFDRVMNINVRSVYQLMMLTVPHLIKTSGNIVNVSSVNGIRSFANVLAYCASKSAIDQLTRCVAIELAAKRVRVNAVNPGVIATGLQKRGGLSDEAFEKFLEHSKTTHAMARVGDASEVANAIGFLASDLASFITGVTLPVDGGRHALCPR